MKSNKNAKILSMKSSFESCELLESLVIDGFNTNKLISLEKAFYNTPLLNIVLNIDTKNI